MLTQSSPHTFVTVTFWPMGDEDEQLQMAFRMSLQSPARDSAMTDADCKPIAKRWKTEEGSPSTSQTHELGEKLTNRPETAEERERRIQREVRAAAAERRVAAMAQTNPRVIDSKGSDTNKGGDIEGSLPVPKEAGDLRPKPGNGGALTPLKLEDRLTGAGGQAANEEGLTSKAQEAGQGPDLDIIADSALADVAIDEDTWQQRLGLKQLPMDEAYRLFDLVFGREPPRATLNQWSHQGFR